MILNVAMAERTIGTADLPRMSRAATVVPGSIDEEARTVEVVWTTGARVPRGFFERYWEELSLDPQHVRMGRLNNGAPVLNAHDSSDASKVIGVVEPGSASVDGKRGTAKLRFSRAEDDADAEKIFRKIKDGIIQNVSVGYATYKMEKVEDGADKIPVYRAVDWEPHEISPVPIGADDGAGFRSANTERNACVFFTRQELTTMADTDKSPTTPAVVESAAVVATRAATAASADERKRIRDAEQVAAEEAIAAERTRTAGLHKLAKQHGYSETWVQNLIVAGTTLPDARAAILDEKAKRDEEFSTDGTVRIGAGDDERDKFIRGASAWLWQRTGTAKLIERARVKNPDLFKDVSLDPGEFRGLSPVELARHSLERCRVSTRGMDRMKMIGLAFTTRTGSYQTTSDFATLLENVLGKVLLGAYGTQENTWERFCGTDEVPDFRTSNRYRTGSLPGLDVIPEHGEYKSGIIPDGSKYALSTQRLGKMFGLSQETIINDDMGALTQMATELGRSAARTIETSVYALLALNSGAGPTQGDGQPFFHAANRANVGTSAVISVASLDLDRVLMRAQKDPNNLDFLDLTPAVLVVPDSLKGTAQVINDAQYDPDTVNKLQRPNMVRGLFRDIVGTPRLAAGTTRRYLFADPAIAAAIVVAYLEGYGRGPVIDSMNGWRIDGVEWKVSLYAKAQMGDPKAAVTNAGT